MKPGKKRVKPFGLKDITIVDDAKMRKAITAADTIERVSFGAVVLVEQPAQGAGAEYLSIAPAKIEKAMPRTIATGITAAEHLGDKARRRCAVIDEDVP